MYDFDKMFPIFQHRETKPNCEYCEGRGVVPKDGKVVTCTKCDGTGKEKQ